MTGDLAGQTVVLIGGSAGIGLETARRARAEGADVILTGRNAERLRTAADDVGARQTAAFDANDSRELRAFFDGVAGTVDHVLVTAGGPSYRPLLEMDAEDIRDALSGHVVLGLEVARSATPKMRPGGSLILMGGTGGRRIDHRLGIVPAATAALPAFAPYSADRAGRRPRRCRCARGAPHGEHCAHRRHLRHRRRPAVHLTRRYGQPV